MTRRLPFLLAAVLAIAALDTACGRTERILIPGTPDTVIVAGPERVDTLVIPHTDTIVSEHHDTTIVVRPETLLVIQHDTVVKHDTVWHVDTVLLHCEPAHVCITLERPDTVYALTPADTLCDGAHLAAQFPGKVMVDVTGSLVLQLPPPAPTYRGTLLLPGYLRSGR